MTVEGQLLSGVPGHPVALNPSFGDGLGEVYLSMEELVPQKMDIPDTVPETLGHYFGGQPFYKGGPKRLIAPLPLMHRAGEVGRIAHGAYIQDAATMSIPIIL